MKLRIGEHICVMGMTGSGKTTFIRDALLVELLRACPRLVIVDSKGGQDFPETVANLYDLEHKYLSKPGPFRVDYRAKNDEDVDVLSAIVHRHGNCIVLFDEVTHYSSPNYIPENMERLIREGRSRNITVICGSQRAAGINAWLRTNSIHRFVFFLSEDELELVSRYYPASVRQFARLGYKKYDFVYTGPDGVPVYYQGVNYVRS